MKIDKHKPSHWLALLLFGLNTAVAMALRPLLHRTRTPRTVILYGHKLAGNLLALHRYISAHAADEFGLVFLTMDKRYARQLHAQGVRVIVATRPAAIALLIRADAVISDHGLHVMSWLPGRCSIRFFDVWHGFGFKGHHYNDFRVLRRYDEIWVDSPLQRSFYIEHFGFAPGKVVATGYARIDALVHADGERIRLRRRFGLPERGRVVLFAPTWRCDAGDHGLFPFGVQREAFYAAMAGLAERTDSVFVTRAHLNAPIPETVGVPRLRFLPFAEYPDTEALLLACDVLLADWSSIVFDWLLLDRPTVFLDVPAPFPVGTTLQPRHRYGQLVSDMKEMVQAVECYLLHPDAYLGRHAEQTALIRREVFGGCADGRATQRCFARLRGA